MIEVINSALRTATNRSSRFSLLTTLLISVFFLGELFGLYSAGSYLAQFELFLSTIQTEQSILELLWKNICLYLPCTIPLMFHRGFLIMPVILFARGYILSCSFVALSNIYANDPAVILSILIQGLCQTTSLVLLSSNIFCYSLVKRKLVFGNITLERKQILKSVFFVFLSILLCMLCECLIFS